MQLKLGVAAEGADSGADADDSDAEGAEDARVVDSVGDGGALLALESATPAASSVAETPLASAAARRRSRRAAADAERMASESGFVDYVDWLNMRGRAASLAGLFHFARAHAL